MRRAIFVVLAFVAISLFFFYPIFRGKVPFPGDLLVGNYAPYNTNSYAGFLPGGVPHKAQGPDVIRQLFPWKQLAVESYQEGRVPLWNPYNLSGNPLMANFQSGVFYPLNIVFLSDFLTGWTFFILLIPILASLFTYLFLRELNVGRKASVFGGVIFAFSSYMTVWMEYGNVGHTFLWLPLVLFFTERLSKSLSVKNAVFLVASLVASLLAGYIQGYFYIFLTSAFYFLIKSKHLETFTLKRYLLFLLVISYPILLSAFQLIPTLELFAFSSRNNYTLPEIGKLLNPLWYTITTIVPNFFGNPASRNHWFYGTYIERVSYFGLTPFIFAVFAILNFKKRIEILIFSVIGFFSMLLATNLFITKFIYLIPLPLLSTTVPTRILSLFVFSGSILAAFGLDLYLQKNNCKLGVALKTIAAVFVLIWIGVVGILMFSNNPELLSNLAIAKNNTILPTLLLASFVILVIINFFFNAHKKLVLNIVIAGIFALTLFDLFYFFHRITPFSPKEYVYPPTNVFEYLKKNASISRSWGYGSGTIENNFQTYEQIYSADGYEPLHIKTYGELISASRDGEVESRVAGSDANIAGGFGSTDLKENKYRQSLLNLLGVKYVLNKSDFLANDYSPDYDTFPEEKYELVWQKAPWQIYENVNVLPRVFLASDYVVEKDKNKIVKMIFDEKFDLRNKIILEEDVYPKVDFSSDPNARVEIKKYTSNEIILKTAASANMLLFLSDNYYAGWRVSVDGENGKIYRADYSFRAVPILKGIREVRFLYDPGSFALGLWVSTISLLGALLALTVFRFRRRNNAK